MISELQMQIDKTIETELSIEENRWIIYEQCKEDLRNYEKENKIYFNHHEWKDYIDYIMNKLKLM